MGELSDTTVLKIEKCIYIEHFISKIILFVRKYERTHCTDTQAKYDNMNLFKVLISIPYT
jgi:hypothetical protein